MPAARDTSSKRMGKGAGSGEGAAVQDAPAKPSPSAAARAARLARVATGRSPLPLALRERERLRVALIAGVERHRLLEGLDGALALVEREVHLPQNVLGLGVGRVHERGLHQRLARAREVVLLGQDAAAD